jgi:hypothetical protein
VRVSRVRVRVCMLRACFRCGSSWVSYAGAATACRERCRSRQQRGFSVTLKLRVATLSIRSARSTLTSVCVLMLGVRGARRKHHRLSEDTRSGRMTSGHHSRDGPM